MPPSAARGNGAVGSVSVSVASPLSVGATARATATVLSVTNRVLKRRVTWSSSDTVVLRVTSDGVVRANAAGSARVVATADGVSGSAPVDVTQPLGPVASVVVTLGASSLLVGETTTATAVTLGASGDTLSGRAVSWHSGNPGVAVVDSLGRVTGVGAGSADIVAMSEGISGQATIGVIAVTTTTATAAQLAVTVQPGGAVSGIAFTTQPVVEVRDANGARVSTSTASVTASVATGTGTLSGTTTVAAVNGIATFANLAITGAGTSSLRFTSGSLTPATSAEFTVQSAPPPPPTATGAEPSGFMLVTERDFALKTENGWLDRGDSRFSIVAEATAPRADKLVGQALFPAGFTAGSGPINTYYYVTGSRTKMYVRLYFRVSPNWQGQDVGINKVLFLWLGASPSVYLNVQGIGSGPLSFRVNTQFPSTTQTRDFSLGNPAYGGTYMECVRGRWYLWEVLLESNSSAGSADGRIQSWIDGVKFADSNVEVPKQTSFPGIVMWDAGQSPYWSQVSWNPTWGGAGGTVISDMFQQIDYIRVSGNP